MHHHGTVKPYDSRMVLVPVVDVATNYPWMAYVFADSCQVPHGQSIDGVLTFLCEDGCYKFVQGLTPAQRAVMHKLEEVFRYMPGRAPPAVLRPGETAATCYDAILNFGTYTCSITDAAPPGEDAAQAAAYSGPWTRKYVTATSSASVFVDGFVLLVKGRPPQPFFQAAVDTTQFVFSTETTGDLPYTYYPSRENCNLDGLCNDMFLPHAIPDAILSCSEVFFPGPREEPRGFVAGAFAGFTTAATADAPLPCLFSAPLVSTLGGAPAPVSVPVPSPEVSVPGPVPIQNE